MRIILALPLLAALYSQSCAGTGGAGGSAIPGNEGGSIPINGDEEKAYKRAVVKCYKTGGTRVVKVEGRLTCY